MSGYRLGVPCLYLSSKCNFIILHLYLVETLWMKGALTVLKDYTFGLIKTLVTTSVIYNIVVFY
jgi:hypothetical protein